jgi:hypothetical protein
MRADGSFLGTMRPKGVGAAQAKARAIAVRVIDSTLPNMPDGQLHDRLTTTLLDDKAAPLELAVPYHRRWAMESIKDRLKTRLVQTPACGAAERRRCCARSSSAGC